MSKEVHLPADSEIGQMGYSFSLQSYCDYCPDFLPIVEHLEATSLGDSTHKRTVYNFISCCNGAMCKRILERNA